MIAGSGALINQQFGLSPVWGNVLMAVFTVVTVLTGIKGSLIPSVRWYLSVNIAVGISIISVVFIPPTAGNTIQVSESTSVLITNWLWAAILYISYNMVLSISVLAIGSTGQGQKNNQKRGYTRGHRTWRCGNSHIFCYRKEF